MLTHRLGLLSKPVSPKACVSSLQRYIYSGSCCTPARSQLHVASYWLRHEAGVCNGSAQFTGRLGRQGRPNLVAHHGDDGRIKSRAKATVKA